jgi:hypothetical protein
LAETWANAGERIAKPRKDRGKEIGIPVRSVILVQFGSAPLVLIEPGV